MSAVVNYIRSFMALFIVLMLLLQLVPGKNLKRYIQFFAEVVLSLGLFFPLLSFLFDSDEFLQKIQYEAFTESLSEISKDTSRMEFLQNDHYLKEYETAVEEDAKQLAERYVEQYDLCVAEANVSMTEQYELSSMEIVLAERTDKITIEPIKLEGEKQTEKQPAKLAICQKLKEELMSYYQMEEEDIEVRYVKSE